MMKNPFQRIQPTVKVSIVFVLQLRSENVQYHHSCRSGNLHESRGRVESFRPESGPGMTASSTELPFPVTESLAVAEFLFGGNRPEHDIPGDSGKVLDAATSDIRATQPYFVSRSKLSLITT
jgi:hypothetical protein